MQIRKRYLVLAALGLGAAFYLRGKRVENVVADLLLELPAQGRSLNKHLESLERSGQALENRLKDLPDTPENREQLRHILSLERWGTNRLRVFAGAAFERDRSSLYRPAEHLDWIELREDFADARFELLEVARSLEGTLPGLKVEHNQLGLLSRGAWLFYLNAHASLEGLKFQA